MKFCGKVGFYEGCEETDLDIYTPKILEKSYTGDILRQYQSFQATENQNDELKLSNRISILADPYARDHWSSIRYVVMNGARLKVNSVELSYPRLILEVGGVWNG